MIRKHIPFFLLLCLYLTGFFGAFAEKTSLILGGKDGWPNPSVAQGIARSSGRFGYESLVLATDSRKAGGKTDLLLSFEGDTIRDETGNYQVVSSQLTTTTRASMGSKAALSRGTQGGLRLKGNASSFFGSQGFKGSFTIEFWLSPSISESGEQIFTWRSSRNIGGYPMYQLIQTSFFNNRLEWSFNNIFHNGKDGKSEVILSSHNPIIPEKWAHHSLSFDDTSGLLEYRINGLLEAMQFVTATGRERGTVFPAFLGVPADIEICGRYTGRIDDFRIENALVSMEPRYDTYALSGGRYESQPLETGSTSSTLNSLAVISDIPAQTDIAFYVRAGDNFYEWTDTWPQWQAVRPGTEIKNVLGRYFQIAADFYPDGTGQKTPSLSQITVQFTKVDPPLPPATIRAVAGDGYVDLNWSSSVDLNTGGYILYYGERPGEYLGRLAVEGVSPVNVEAALSFRLSGLSNGKIYYFAVAAYSASDNRILGAMSKEVYARPLRKTQ